MGFLCRTSVVAPVASSNLPDDEPEVDSLKGTRYIAQPAVNIHRRYKPMKHSHRVSAIVLLVMALPLFAFTQTERIDTAVVAKIKAEGLANSQIMDLLSSLCDVYSPRLAWSPEYKRGADWVVKKLGDWRINTVYYDRWAPMGKGWTLKNFSAMVTTPVPYPVIAFPLAWSAALKEKNAEVIYLEAKTPDDLAKYKGKLKGKFVLISDPMEVKPHFEASATRLADSTLLRMANADMQGGRRGRRGPGFIRPNVQNIDSAIAAAAAMFPGADTAAIRRRFMEMRLGPMKLNLAATEGALAVLTASSSDDGTVLAQSASLPRGSDESAAPRLSVYDPKAPDTVPQVVVAAEHYNRMIRMLGKGEKVHLEMEIDAVFSKPDSGFNIIAEIPGSDLKDEVVMLGAHFDTWHAGTGATDNNTGTATCLEAMRILRVLSEKYGFKPRRTIRMGLWGAEEEGLIGSREYVSEVFGKRDTAGRGEGAPGGFGGFGGPAGPVIKTPAFDKLSVYFNHDNGSGRVRGIYLQGDEAARPIFRSWLTAYNDPTAQTITIQNTGGTDHQSFDGIGLPGFQFIQDPLDYDSRTHHYNMDVYERIVPDDMKQAASIMALFVYHAANRDEKFPRKPSGPAGR
jgi:carboxypeptidase Q